MNKSRTHGIGRMEYSRLEICPAERATNGGQGELLEESKIWDGY